MSTGSAYAKKSAALQQLRFSIFTADSGFGYSISRKPFPKNALRASCFGIKQKEARVL
jgi:hypothetical protein